MTRDEVRELFDYDAETGELRWRKHRYAPWVGTVAGGVQKDGYRRVCFQTQYRCKSYPAHRLIWLWVYGEWPPVYIDHINMDKDDNRLVNLRLATRSQNLANQRSFNKNGFKGISPVGSRWRANIQKDRKSRYLGTFDTPEQAHAAYCEAAKQVHGEFMRSK